MSSGRMSSGGRRGGGRRGPERNLVDSIREATGASVEDIRYQLQECEGDINKATEQLIDCPFTVVQPKKSRIKPLSRGRGRGAGREMNGSGGGTGRRSHDDGRGYRAYTRGRGRGRGAGRGKARIPPGKVEEKGEGNLEKKKEVHPPVPMKKAYLEALCGAGKQKTMEKEQVLEERVTNMIESGWEEATPPPECILHEMGTVQDVLEQTLTTVQENLQPVTDSQAPELAMEKSEKQKMVEEEDVCKENEDQTLKLKSEIIVISEPKPETGHLQEQCFPIPMQDIRFTREDPTPISALSMPIPQRTDLYTSGMLPHLDANPIDLSEMEYLFGTFAGVSKPIKLKEEETTLQANRSQMDPLPQEQSEEDPPSIPAVSIQVTKTEENVKSSGEDQGLSESLHSDSHHVQESELELSHKLKQHSNLASAPLPPLSAPVTNVEFSHDQKSTEDPVVSLETYAANINPTTAAVAAAAEFRLDVGTQVLDIETQSPQEQRTYLSAGVQSSPIPKDKNPHSHHHRHHLIVGSAECRPEKRTLSPAPIQVLEDNDYAKSYHRTELKSVDVTNTEDLGATATTTKNNNTTTSATTTTTAPTLSMPSPAQLSTSTGPTFESSENRQMTHKGPSSMVDTKPIVVSDPPPPPPPSYTISSGPTPSLPVYQTQRHTPHKLPEKTVTAVGGVTTSTGVGGHQNSKYGNHQVPPPPPPHPAGVPGQNTGHVPVTLNPNNNANSTSAMNNNANGGANNNGNSGTNASLPIMPQLPFLNPGMMPNPAMAFPPGHPYYPQFMQYQHQMYHGMYAGTYGGFGAPFNHESVGHPAHVNPPGVPPNQANQQFPVSFPNALYTLGNNVYDVPNPSSFSNTKDKDNVFLAQQQQLQHGFPGGPQPVARNDGNLFYGVPGQAFTQGVRTQYHQGPQFAGQFPGGGVVAPPHNYHPTGQQGNNFRLQ